jgi:predicted DsbA family dithiol-disulfide isomerase
VNVEIWSDVVCPWCYIGKRRFEAALARFAHSDAVTVVWRSFELDPHAPARRTEGLDALLAAKYGMSPERARALHAQMTELAAAEGLEYHFEHAQSGNTFDAHRLLHLAAVRGRQGELKERLLRAYFTEGRAIGDHETLVAIATEAGLPAGEAREVLAGSAYAAEVRADERRAAGFGITGVPFVAIDERYGVSGAQPVEVFLTGLETAWAAAHPRIMAGADANACDDGSCAVPTV